MTEARQVNIRLDLATRTTLADMATSQNISQADVVRQLVARDKQSTQIDAVLAYTVLACNLMRLLQETPSLTHEFGPLLLDTLSRVNRERLALQDLLRKPE